ncbi:Hypothetical protein IALB_0781 [Ignavibacterium album JCM 16511]|uniref:Coenzyme Q-binding protein COQ10 START domain-containing protein n=1 Tax=Ignavibacterium album (strain DSM 19864 / JCM 16511 / NBRC 101810 / Mat9-16) TaxID=945713 RepID=I0AHN6_IGNAJ|nr:SRPBCC family protein [Ignavibacterium album]AFH48493.1 Hypothetical protein IALB_0781 [Ignavibacterium album JCM 16511]
MPKIIASDSVELNYSLEKVWSVISDFQSYKFWWPKIVKLQIIQADKQIIGTILKASPLGGKSFSIRVVEIFPLKEIKLEYFDGLYRGFGHWKVENKNDSTILIYVVNLEIVDSLTKGISYLVPVSKIHSMIFRKIFTNLGIYLKENG